MMKLTKLAIVKKGKGGEQPVMKTSTTILHRVLAVFLIFTTLSLYCFSQSCAADELLLSLMNPDTASSSVYHTTLKKQSCELQDSDKEAVECRSVETGHSVNQSSTCFHVVVFLITALFCLYTFLLLTLSMKSDLTPRFCVVRYVHRSDGQKPNCIFA